MKNSLPRPRSSEEIIDRLQALETRVAVYEERITKELDEITERLLELHALLADINRRIIESMAARATPK